MTLPIVSNEQANTNLQINIDILLHVYYSNHKSNLLRKYNSEPKSGIYFLFHIKLSSIFNFIVWKKAVAAVPYWFGNTVRWHFSPFQTIPKNLGPSHKMDLNFKIVLGEKTPS